MNEDFSIIHTTDRVGRLPERTVASPLSLAAFTDLAAVWRPFGLWLTMWNSEGQPAAHDAEGPALWTTLWTRGVSFKQLLRDLARKRMRELETQPDDAAMKLCPIGPGESDFGLLAIPLRSGRRIVGLLLAALRSGPRMGEEFARLCGRCEQDETAMRALAESVRSLSADEIAPAGAALSLAARQARETETAREELASLTHNLQNTYEELHLVYQVSGRMSLANPPPRTLRDIGQELLEVSRAAGVAFVLCEFEKADLNRPAGGATPSAAERMVQVGRAAPTLHDLDRLAESLNIVAGKRTGQLLLNDAGDRPELHWAHSWLKHLMALPLWHEERLLGVLLAINCKDAGDFTSVDLQLFRAVADRVTPFLENQRLYVDLADLLMGLLHSLINSIDAKDPYTCGHSERVAYISRALARESGLPEDQCERVYLAGLLHDVGKIGVPDAILCKPGRLTKEEFDVLKQHPEIGARILSRVRQIQDLIPGVLYHHERMDGRGYPSGLDARNIPMLGRIICLADCFDAMTTNRTYRAALPLPVALAEIRRCAGTQFDVRLAEAFLRLDLGRVLNEARAFTGAGDLEGQLQGVGPVLGFSTRARMVGPCQDALKTKV